MRRSYSGIAIALAAVAALSLGTHRAHAMDCQGLTGRTLGNGFIVETDNGTPPFGITAPDSFPPRAASVNAPYCRVRGVLAPPTDSEIIFELWLSPAANWNGR